MLNSFEAALQMKREIEAGRIDESLLPPRGQRPRLTKAEMRTADEITLRAIVRRQYRFAGDSPADRLAAQAELRRRREVSR